MVTLRLDLLGAASQWELGTEKAVQPLEARNQSEKKKKMQSWLSSVLFRFIPPTIYFPKGSAIS